MTRKIVALCALAICFTSSPGYGQIQSTLDAMTDESWETTPEPRTYYWTATGDTALVLSTDEDFWIRARVDGVTWLHCDPIATGPFAVQELVASADSVLYEGTDRGINGPFMRKVNCVTTFPSVNDSLATQ